MPSIASASSKWLEKNQELISILSDKIISSNNITIIEKIFGIICNSCESFNLGLARKIMSYKSERNLLNLIKYCLSIPISINAFEPCIKFINILSLATWIIFDHWNFFGNMY